MAKWKYKLDFKPFYHNDKITIEEKGRAVSNEIRRVFPSEWFDITSDDYDSYIDEAAEAFCHIDDVEEFDGWMESLYDFCDMEIEPFGKWPPNKMAWVATF